MHLYNILCLISLLYFVVHFYGVVTKLLLITNALNSMYCIQKTSPFVKYCINNFIVIISLPIKITDELLTDVCLHFMLVLRMLIWRCNGINISDTEVCLCCSELITQLQLESILSVLPLNWKPNNIRITIPYIPSIYALHWISSNSPQFLACEQQKPHAPFAAIK
jgi:hypothetical protein